MRKYNYLMFIILGLSHSTLSAEVQSVVMRWIPGRCQEGCQERLNESLGKSKEVEKLTINDTNGSASIIWNPETKFSYRLLKRPMQRVGVGIDSIAVAVRGKIKKVGSHIVLTSEGDETDFRLVSYDERKPSARYLSLNPQVEEQLTDKANNNKIFVVDGPLYQPHRSPPFYLIVSKVQIEK